MAISARLAHQFEKRLGSDGWAVRAMHWFGPLSWHEVTGTYVTVNTVTERHSSNIPVFDCLSPKSSLDTYVWMPVLPVYRILNTYVIGYRIHNEWN